MKKIIEQSKVKVEAHQVEVEKKVRLTPVQKSVIIEAAQDPDGRFKSSWGGEPVATLVQLQLAVKQAVPQKTVLAIQKKIAGKWNEMAAAVKRKDLDKIYSLREDIKSLTRQKDEEGYYLTAAGREYLDKGRVLITV